MTDVKIRAASSISANKIKFNWDNFFVHQLCQAAKDFNVSEEDPTLYTLKGKMRYARCIPYALEKLYPDHIWEGDWSIYKNPQIFSDLLRDGVVLVDAGIINVNIPPAVRCILAAAPSKPNRKPKKAFSTISIEYNFNVRA